MQFLLHSTGGFFFFFKSVYSTSNQFFLGYQMQYAITEEFTIDELILLFILLNANSQYIEKDKLEHQKDGL